MDILLDFIGFSRINGAIRRIVSAQSGNPLSVRDVKGLRDYRLILPNRAKFSPACHGGAWGAAMFTLYSSMANAMFTQGIECSHYGTI